ncbi:MAG: acyltransferase [Daejeonella sp.]
MIKKTSVLGSRTIPQAAVARANYEEIDTIRFLTISIIVWGHSLFPEWHSRVPANITEEIIKVIVIQVGAISTVAFFLVSGILMNSKLQDYSLRRYFNQRIPKVYEPWVFIVGFNAMLIVLHRLYLNEISLSGDYKQLIYTGYDIMRALLIYGPYWFVVTYFFGMMILILLKQFSANLYFGVMLMSITLFYSINFYYEWIDTLHTKAVLAYTFFIWLGFQLQRRWNDLLKWVARIKWPLLIFVLILLFSLAAYDGYKLSKEGVNDSFASNRLINIVFSLLFFVALLKMGEIRRINKLQPRKIVYGIYLINSIIILELTFMLRSHHDALSEISIWTLLGLQLIYFSVVLLLTWLIVNYLAGSRRLAWIIGQKAN